MGIIVITVKIIPLLGMAVFYSYIEQESSGPLNNKNCAHVLLKYGKTLWIFISLSRFFVQ